MVHSVSVSPRSRNVARLVSMLGLLALTSCSTTNVSDREEYVGPKLPRPTHVIVYDFVASPGDLPGWSDAREAYADASVDMNADDLDAARKLGADVAKELVSKIDAMGLDGVRAAEQPDADLNDIALIGYFTSIDQGSAAKRVLIGFGAGTASVGAHAEGYRRTGDGMVKLGAGSVGSGGAGKGPGLIVPTIATIATANPIGLAVGGAVKAEGEISGRTTDVGAAERIAKEIAEILQSKFEEQGWI